MSPAVPLGGPTTHLLAEAHPILNIELSGDEAIGNFPRECSSDRTSIMIPTTSAEHPFIKNSLRFELFSVPARVQIWRAHSQRLKVDIYPRRQP